MPEDLHLDLGRYVPGLLNFLSNKLSAGASKCYRKHFGVGVVEWRMLSMLAVENGITANRICQVIGLDKSAVSRSLQQLEEANYVTTAVDARDARRYTVSLTSEGKALHDQIFLAAMERERRLLADLSPEEVSTLTDLLGRMHRRIEYVNGYEPE
ncbi:MarR family transcriptional regulator [Pseudomonas sp. PB101]|uniref:MarR family winged helix-turn-helix transcriptional regulator n=1 Tax=Pseudomonas sp. PB101 TaxID=2495428 RepID=UPI00136547C6|nr:MarR family transcriptional regulator [Pseudomonas sp. PB101]MVW84791.1 MarR family transcriptional regulator [Pseudomonas sp. PB101]